MSVVYDYEALDARQQAALRGEVHRAEEEAPLDARLANARLYCVQASARLVSGRSVLAGSRLPKAIDARFARVLAGIDRLVESIRDAEDAERFAGRGTGVDTLEP